MSAELVGRETEMAACPTCSPASGSSRSSGQAASARRRSRSRPAAALTVVERVGPGGVWLARLETAVTAHDVIDTVIAALNVTGGEAALFERLKGTAALVILDNCEHVIDAAAALAVRLLDAAPGLRILCTSQVPLDVDGEAVFELAPLALSDAVELFTRRATAQRMNQTLGEADDAVLDLCRSLDGLPLAIELAAARTKTLSIEEITRRLDDRFNVLSDPTSRRPERRRALKSTIRWSYELLFPDDQRGLWALATFAGGAPLPAVEFVLAALDVPAAAAIDVVGRLASRSLVIVDDEGASMPVRYRLLDSIRAFALEAMADAGLSERALAAHAAWFADAAGSSTQGVRSSRQAEHLAFARAERANIDAALAWSATHDPLLALGIVNGFGWAWVVLGDSRGAQRILAALDAAGDAAPVRDRASALLLAAWIEASTGHLELARDHIAAADRAGRRDRRRRPAGALLLLPRLRRVASRRVPPGDGADRSQSRALRRRWTGRGIRPRTGSSPPEPRSRPATRSAASRLRDHVAALAANGRRPVAARSRRRDARRAGPHPAPVRRCRRPPRSRRGDVATARLPADGGVPGRPASDERSARPVTTTPVRPPWSSRSTRPRPPVTCAWRRSPGFISGASSVRSDRSHERGRRSKRRRRGTAPPAAENRPRSASACWPRWTPRIGSPAPRNVSSRSSTTPGATTTPTSRSSPSTRSPASPPKRATSPRHGTSVRRPIGAWKPPPTSSPTSTEPTPTAVRQIA